MNDRERAMTRAGNVLRAFGFKPQFVHRYDPRRACEWAVTILTHKGACATISESPFSGHITTTFDGLAGLTPTLDPRDPRAD